jgi:DegV family protein with EDD domain
VSAVHLVADSTCDLSGLEAAELGLTIVPLKVIIGDEVYADGIDIDSATLYARMRASQAVPRTSQPTPSEFEAVFRRLGADGAPIVCTTISAPMSGTHSSATQARAALPELDIRVIDTRTVGPGHRQVVEALVGAAGDGAGADELEAVAAAIRATQRLVFTVESLEYLRRGGRIGGARALLGSMLNIKPVLEVRDGSVEPLDRVRTFPRALDRLLEELSAAVAGWGGRGRVMVTHAEQPVAAAEVARRAAEIAGEPARQVALGPVIGCHGGPGAIGLSFHKPL